MGDLHSVLTASSKRQLSRIVPLHTTIGLAGNPDQNGIDRLFKNIGADKEIQLIATGALLRMKCRSRPWSEAIEIALKTKTEDATGLRNLLVFELAQSERLRAETPKQELELIQDYLRRALIDFSGTGRFALP